MALPSYVASRRLASMRKNREMCDAWFEVYGKKIPVHMAVVADISPVFKAALCGGFKEGQSKTISLKDSTRRSVDAILDFAYGTISDGLRDNVELCLEVWRDAHVYQIDMLQQKASNVALTLASSKHRCEVLKHAALYGTDEECEQARGVLAEEIIWVSKNCPSFRTLDSKQMVLVFSSKYLVATEDEKLDVMLKWKGLNPKVSAKEIGDIFCLLRLQRLTRREQVEKLCLSKDCPGSLAPKVAQICFNKLNEDIAMRKQTKQLPLETGGLRMFLRKDEWEYFSFKNLAMAACTWCDKGFMLICENRENKDLAYKELGDRSYLEQVKSQWISLTIQHASLSCIGHVVYKIRFTNEPFCVEVEYPEAYNKALETNDYDFWMTLSTADAKNLQDTQFWRKENADIYVTEHMTEAETEKTTDAKADEVTNDNMSATENASETGG